MVCRQCGSDIARGSAIKNERGWGLAASLGCVLAILCLWFTPVSGATLKEAKRLNAQVAAFYKQGRYTEAIASAEKALKIVKEVLGEKHLGTAASYNNLGVIYISMGNYRKALPMCNKALLIKKEVLGEKHPSTATSYSNLGKLYESMNDYGKAEPLLQKALAIHKETLGEKHPSTATSYSNLGTLYKSMSDYGKAEPLLQKALVIKKKTLDEKHPSTATSYSNLGLLYESMGDYSKAESLLRKSLAIKKEALGETHPSTVTNYNNLGEIYLAMGKVDAALNIFKKTDSPTGVGRCYLARDDYKEALSQFEKSLSNIRKPTRKGLIIADHIGLGLSYEGLGEYTKAGKQFEKAIKIIEDQSLTLPFAFKKNFLEGKSGGFSRLNAYEGLLRVINKEKKEGYEKEALLVAEQVKSITRLELPTTRNTIDRNKDEGKSLAFADPESNSVPKKSAEKAVKSVEGLLPKKHTEEVKYPHESSTTRKKYRIQVISVPASSSETIIGFAKEIQMKLQLDVFLIRKDGRTKVHLGSYDTRKEAIGKLTEIRKIVRDAYVVESHDKHIIKHLPRQQR